MTDCFTKKKRSEVMARIRSKNTKAELLVFRELRKRGIYFQKHYKKAIGKPDIALPREKIAVFIDGDFWHGWQFAKNRKRLPKKYWVKKIEGNISRDRKNRQRLKKQGWKVLRVWEHNVAKEYAINKILFFLSHYEKEKQKKYKQKKEKPHSVRKAGNSFIG